MGQGIGGEALRHLGHEERQGVLASGPAPRRRCSSCATIRPARHPWPDWRKNMAQGRPSPSWLSHWPGRSMTCEHGIRCAIWRHSSTGKGAAWASLRPHWVTRGSAGRPCSATMPPLRLCTPLSTSALGPDPARLLGRLLPLLSGERQSLRVTVCCPSPAPEPHWSTAMCSPSFEEDGRRVQRSFSGAKHHGSLAPPSRWRQTLNKCLVPSRGCTSRRQ